MRKNRNRGYQKLRVWNDAIRYYMLTCEVFRPFPHDLKRVVSQQIASVDSVHRNIAEGYCRRSIKEYLNFLNISLGSLGESVSGLHAYAESKQISKEPFEKLDSLAYKLENGLLRLVESLEKNVIVETGLTAWSSKRAMQSMGMTKNNSMSELFQYSTTPILHHSIVLNPKPSHISDNRGL